MPAGFAEHDYFANGLTEDLITALSSIRWLFVIARISSDSMNRIVHWLRSNGSARTSRSPSYESTTSFRVPMRWRIFLRTAKVRRTGRRRTRRETDPIGTTTNRIG